MVGDPEYGTPGRLGLERQFLHAARLAFAQPFTGAAIDIASPLPADLAAALGGRAPRPARRSPGGRSSWPSAKSRSTSFSGVSGSSSWPSLKRPMCSSSGESG